MSSIFNEDGLLNEHALFLQELLQPSIKKSIEYCRDNHIQYSELASLFVEMVALEAFILFMLYGKED
jgi:hypothetical protein